MNTTKLAKKIKNGKLEVTASNARKVEEALIETSYYNAILTGPILGSLPDPHDISSQPKIFEDWLVDAFSANFPTKKDCRNVIKNLVESCIHKLTYSHLTHGFTQN